MSLFLVGGTFHIGQCCGFGYGELRVGPACRLNIVSLIWLTLDTQIVVRCTFCLM